MCRALQYKAMDSYRYIWVHDKTLPRRRGLLSLQGRPLVEVLLYVHRNHGPIYLSIYIYIYVYIYTHTQVHAETVGSKPVWPSGKALGW